MLRLPGRFFSVYFLRITCTSSGTTPAIKARRHITDVPFLVIAALLFIPPQNTESIVGTFRPDLHNEMGHLDNLCAHEVRKHTQHIPMHIYLKCYILGACQIQYSHCGLN